jgi:hypothetical protein
MAKTEHTYHRITIEMTVQVVAGKDPRDLARILLNPYPYRNNAGLTHSIIVRPESSFTSNDNNQPSHEWRNA